MTHSTDLQWLLVRRNSKFFQLRNGVRLSSDALNASRNWTKRSSGFLNAAGWALRAKGGKIVASMKSGAASQQPKKAFTKQEFAAGTKASEIARAVAKVRPDQREAAFRVARRVASVAARTAKVMASRKQRSQKIQYKRKAVRAKKQ